MTNYDSEKETFKVECTNCGHVNELVVEAEVRTETQIIKIKEA